MVALAILVALVLSTVELAVSVAVELTPTALLPELLLAAAVLVELAVVVVGVAAGFPQSPPARVRVLERYQRHATTLRAQFRGGQSSQLRIR